VPDSDEVQAQSAARSSSGFSSGCCSASAHRVVQHLLKRLLEGQRLQDLLHRRLGVGGNKVPATVVCSLNHSLMSGDLTPGYPTTCPRSRRSSVRYPVWRSHRCTRPKAHRSCWRTSAAYHRPRSRTAASCKCRSGQRPPGYAGRPCASSGSGERLFLSRDDVPDGEELRPRSDFQSRPVLVDRGCHGFLPWVCRTGVLPCDLPGLGERAEAVIVHFSMEQFSPTGYVRIWSIPPMESRAVGIQVLTRVLS